MERINIISIEEAPKVPYNLEGRVLYTSVKTEIVHLTLKPGEKIDLHTQPFDVLFYVLEGNGLLLPGDSNNRLPAGSLAEVKAGLQRGWINDTGNDFRVLVIKLLS